jgi:hypothetical protein
MYPKQSPFAKNQIDGNRLSKRDNLARLLINKFRQKFIINFQQDSFLD